MARFINKMDAKGRIFIPAKLRDQIGSPMFVTLNQDKGYLSIYSNDRFQGIVEQFSKIPMTNPKIRYGRTGPYFRQFRALEPYRCGTFG